VAPTHTVTRMGDVVPLRSPRARRDTTAWLGMIIFLASWAMMFAALFFAYGIVRLRAQVWPPPELPALPLRLPLVNTGEDHIGWMTPEIWAGMETILRQQGVLEAPLDVTAVYTTRFLEAIYRRGATR